MTSKRSEVGIKDVAAAAGVSVTTVHHALHGTGRMAESTRGRVLAAVERLGYSPNPLGVALRRGRTTIIGVVLSAPREDWFADLLEGITESVGAGRGVLMGFSQHALEREQALVEGFLQQGVAGLLVRSADLEVNGGFYRELVHRRVPLVFLGDGLTDQVTDSVRADDFAGGYRAGQHLAQRGRRRMAFITADRTRIWERRRQAGFAQALHDAGLPSPEVVALSLTNSTAPRTELHSPSEWAAAAAAYRAEVEAQCGSAVMEYLEAGGRPEAIFAANDYLALASLQALRRFGLLVPEDVAVVGFDDVAASAASDPPLTTLRYPSARMGEEAMRVLMERLEAEEERPPQAVLLEPPLIVRASCGGRI